MKNVVTRVEFLNEPMLSCLSVYPGSHDTGKQVIDFVQKAGFRTRPIRRSRTIELQHANN